MNESIENNWKHKMDEPETFQDFIPKDVRKRIEKKLFPSRRILWWRPALSHAAALIVGILATWFIASYKDSNEIKHTLVENVALQYIQPNTTLMTDTAHTDEKTDQAPEGIRVKKSRKQPFKEKTIYTNNAPLSPARHKEQQAIVHNRPDKDNVPVHHQQPEEKPVHREQEQPIATVFPKKKTVIPVSDIAPVAPSMTFTEKISQSMHPQTASKNQSSPFKIFNR